MDNNLNFFPNWIYLPKIVPLVYDDCLSYYEFLNKVLVKLNEVIQYANNLNLEVEQLKTAVETLQTLVDGFDDRITGLETNMTNLQSTVDSINSSIENINNAIDSLQAQIYDEENYRRAGDEAVRSDLTNALNSYAATINNEVTNLTNIVNDITPTLASYDARITALEKATIGALTPLPSNRFLSADFRHLETVDFEIVNEVEGGTNPSIVLSANAGGWSSSPSLSSSFTLISFKSSGDASHLIVKNVFPYYYNASKTEGFALSALLWNGTGVQYFEIGELYTVNQAISGVQTSGGTTGSTNHRLFADFKLVLNQDSGNFDLYIYNGRNTYVNTNNLRLLALFISDTVLTQPKDIIKWWNTDGLQAEYIAKKQNETTLSAAKDYTDTQIVVAKSYADSVSNTAKAEAVSDANDYTDGKIETFVDALDPELYEGVSYLIQGQDTTSSGSSTTMNDVFVFDQGVTHNVYRNTRILECSGRDYIDSSGTEPEYLIDPNIMIVNICLSASNMTFNSGVWSKICEVDLEELMDVPNDSYIRPIAGRELALLGTQYLGGSMSSNNPVQFRLYNNSGTIELQARYFGENRIGIQVFVNGIVVFDYVNS